MGPGAHLRTEESAMQRLRSLVVRRSSAPEALSPSSADDCPAFFALASPDQGNHFLNAGCLALL